MRLLIADDEENLAHALKAVLEDAGYNCDVCFDGKSAIRLISQEIYDGLILDIMMPEKNGYEVLSLIRKKKMDIPVLLLSALNEVDDKVQGFDLGANDYLSKPFSTKELIARIKVMLKENIVATSVQVEGCGDFLPRYAGNLDIITCAAIEMAEHYACKLLQEEGGCLF